MDSVNFRCWYCGKRYIVDKSRIGEIISCGCSNQLRIPKSNHGYSRIKKPSDIAIEALVYGVGSGLIIAGIVYLFTIKLPFLFQWKVVGVSFLIGFVIGFFGGERGVNWLGSRLRRYEE